MDSNDKDRLSEAKEELHGILDSDAMRGVPVVVIANKQDLPCKFIFDRIMLLNLSYTNQMIPNLLWLVLILKHEYFYTIQCSYIKYLILHKHVCWISINTMSYCGRKWKS